MLIQANIAGIIVRSFAMKKQSNAHNLILWNWGDAELLREMSH